MNITRILIVEGNVIVAEDIKMRLERMGYHVTDCVTRGEAVIDSVDKNTPDLILMGIKLKGEINGIETSSRIHASRHDIPVIYLTAYADEENLERAKRTEPFGYIGKPFEDKDLRSVIEIAIYKHQMERRLKVSEERFRKLFETAPLGYQSLDENGRFIEVNQTWLDLFGYQQKEVIGRSFGDFVHPDWQDHFKKNFSRFKSIGEILGIEFEMLKRDGALFTVSINGKITKDEKGRFLRTHCILTDITARKQAENKLRQYEHIISTTTDMLALIDKNFVYLSTNAAYLQAFAKTSDEVIGRTVAEVFGEEFFSTVIKPRADRCLAGENIRYQDWFEFPAAGRKYMDVSYSPYLGQTLRSGDSSSPPVTSRSAKICRRSSHRRRRWNPWGAWQAGWRTITTMRSA